MMKKAGILTYHNTRNCGALLQAYALGKVLTDMGCNADIIDYRCRKIDDSYKIKRISENKNIKDLIKWVLTVKNDKLNQKKFDLFRSRYLKLSEPYDRNNIPDANKIYDSFITGSDQVWNFYLNGEDFTYLLDFATGEKTRLSYAASMGSSVLKDDYTDVIKRELAKFKDVSVRETPLFDYVKKLGCENPKLVLDPTLLLDKQAYEFSTNEPIEKDKYIFVYTIAATPNIERVARALSERTGYKIIWGHMSYKKKKGVINRTAISPDEFTNYIKNAEYVLTSSFHGMAFSIIMEKQFFYDLDVKKGNNNSRLETLSELLLLGNRELSQSDTDLSDKDIIDYNEVNAILSGAREESIDFLKSNII